MCRRGQKRKRKSAERYGGTRRTRACRSLEFSPKGHEWPFGDRLLGATKREISLHLNNKAMSKIPDNVLSRFFGKVENYVKYRPHYPPGTIPLLQAKIGLSTQHVVADIGSGSGIFTELLLKNGNTVYAVEPNSEMRLAAEGLLSKYSRFISVEGRAEKTTLAEGSVDYVISAQAFHWFNLTEARNEFLRILRPPCSVVLIYNERIEQGSLFVEGYEQLLQNFGADYLDVRRQNIRDAGGISRFFGPSGCAVQKLPWFQHFTFQQLKGKLLSTTYLPAEGTPGFKAMLRELENLFDAAQEDGIVCQPYETAVYYGKLQ